MQGRRPNFAGLAKPWHVNAQESGEQGVPKMGGTSPGNISSMASRFSRIRSLPLLTHLAFISRTVTGQSSRGQRAPAI